MATVKLIIRGKTNPSNLYVRFTNGRSVDIFYPSNIFINPGHWDNKKSNYKNSSSIKNRIELASKFDRLKINIIEEHNKSYMLGDVIDRAWLETVVKNFFNRPDQEVNNKIEDHFVYYLEFASWWLKEIAPTWKTEKNKFIGRRGIQQYETFVLAFKNFQKQKKNHRYKIKDMDSVVLNDFSTYLCDKAKFSSSTSKRLVGRLKFFLNRADKMGMKTDPSYKERVYVSKEEEDVLVPYLNEDEINSIFKLDLSHDHTLDNIRDSFIISLWSGLRISDFNKNLDINNIEGDFINIRTKKTGSWVTIPLHPQVKFVLKKRFGNLPMKFSDKHFNEHVKTVCMLAEIDQNIKGKLFIKEKKRKVIDVYPKWKLISSHTGRRSFCSNLFGKVPNSVIQKVGGWASEKMMLHYVKKTNKEYATQLRDHWNS